MVWLASRGSAKGWHAHCQIETVIGMLESLEAAAEFAEIEALGLSPYALSSLKAAYETHDRKSWCSALAKTTTMPGAPEHVVARALKRLEASSPHSTVTEGHVIIAPRRHLEGTVDVEWLCNWVFNHPNGASLMLVPPSVQVAAPFHIAQHAELEQARRAAELFRGLVWGTHPMGMEEAWQASYALAS